MQPTLPLACRRVDGAVSEVDFAEAVVVDHGDSPALNRILEALPISFVADTHNGISPISETKFPVCYCENRGSSRRESGGEVKLLFDHHLANH